MHPHPHMQSSLEVTDVSVMPVDVLSEEIRSNLHQRYPEVTEVYMAKHLSHRGVSYSKGMLIVHGSADGLPKFNKIMQLHCKGEAVFSSERCLCLV